MAQQSGLRVKTEHGTEGEQSGLGGPDDGGEPSLRKLIAFYIGPAVGALTPTDSGAESRPGRVRPALFRAVDGSAGAGVADKSAEAA
jgi:hypothetical protein